MVRAVLDRPSITSVNAALDNRSTTQGKFEKIENVSIVQQEVYTYCQLGQVADLGQTSLTAQLWKFGHVDKRKPIPIEVTAILTIQGQGVVSLERTFAAKAAGSGRNLEWKERV